MAKKAYAVYVGRKPGVYLSWDECKAQVDGFSGASYKGFLSEELARQSYEAEQGKETKAPEAPNLPRPTKGICADGACSGNPGLMEYRITKLDGATIFTSRKFQRGTNNIAEFLALVEALKNEAEQANPVYSDSSVAITWVQSGIFDIPPCLKAEDSCYWFSDRTYHFRFPIHSRGACLPSRSPLRGGSLMP